MARRQIRLSLLSSLFFFFFNDTATTEIYTLSLHDALPIFGEVGLCGGKSLAKAIDLGAAARSEEHTSELQSPQNLVCRLLLEKKKTKEPPEQAAPRRLGWNNTHRFYLLCARTSCRRALPRWHVRPSRLLFGLFFFFLNKREPPGFNPFPHPAPLPS